MALYPIRVRGAHVCCLALSSLIVPLAGCNTPAQTAALIGGTIVGTTIVGARSPGHEIEQIYYLGAFDPHGQVPPTIYRLTVRGQASSISNMKFGSGWVQAGLIDSLNTHVGFDGDRPVVTKGPDGDQSTLTPGRRLMLFGPEGFREAPKDHRLVIVMGSNPEAFFRAIDESLGAVADTQVEASNSQASQKLFAALRQITDENQQLAALQKDVATDIPEVKGAN